LPAPGGNGIIPVINNIMGLFDTIIASKDWHPSRTKHFGKWPVHCIRETEGAEFPEAFNREQVQKLFLKGTGTGDDGYSAFEATNSDLQSYLEEQGVTRLFLSGLTTEYCVKATALDAIRRGFLTFLIKDAVAGVEAREDDVEKAIREMEMAGVIITDSKMLELM